MHDGDECYDGLKLTLRYMFTEVHLSDIDESHGRQNIRIHVR
jgi:hypothetical protein